MNIAILGAGAWGTALAVSLCRVHHVVLWGRDAERMNRYERHRENTHYLPNVRLPQVLTLTTDLAEAVSNREVVFLATSMAGLRTTASRISSFLYPGCVVVSLCKGFEQGGYGYLSSHILTEVLSPDFVVGVFSGPGFAREIADGLPAALVLALNNPCKTHELAKDLHHSRLRVYGNEDLMGVQVGGAVKNVLAIATGVSDGLGFGLNARAALMTRGLAEMTRLAVALGGEAQTMVGLSGVGDLILTCTGTLSRNRQVGMELARGKALTDIIGELGHVAEGVQTCYETRILSEKYGVDMPITEAMNHLLCGQRSPHDVVKQLLARPQKVEQMGSYAPSH